MRKRFWLASLLLLAGLIVGLVYALTSPKEPMYKGKKLSAWLKELPSWLTHRPVPGEFRKMPLKTQLSGATNDSLAPEIALGQIGSNAIPTLMRMLRAKDSKFKVMVMDLAQKQSLFKIDFIPAERKHRIAYDALYWLGTEADSAAPELIKIFDENISPHSQNFALGSLCDIGPAARTAIPSLLAAITTTNADLRARLIVAMGCIDPNNNKVYSAIAKSLHDPEIGVRATAAAWIGNIHADPEKAIPDLTPLLQDTDQNVRSSAEHSLNELGWKGTRPQGASKVLRE